ncbi:MAG: hypothetical protein L0323_14550 [Planctomycetes bacterium]|nr:hypothetical protein [Planctomycetota bacterium]
MSFRRPLLAAVLLLAATSGASAQCAMCKEALESGTSQAASLARGMGWTIALLLGTFFSLAGGFVYLVVRHGRTTPVPPPEPPEG